MRTTFLLSLLLILHINCALTQSVPTTIGARVTALGNSSSVISDEWSLLNNIGGLSKTKEISTSFSIEMKPALPGSSRMAAIFCTPLKKGAIGAGIFKFGDNIYSEQILTTGYSNQLGIAALGVKLNYIQYRAEGFGTTSALSISAGGVADITPQLSIGAYIQNINQPKLNADERLPTRIAAGISLKPAEHVLLVAEVEKDLTFDPIVKAGIEYCVLKKVFARTGFNLHPEAAFFGIGFKGWRLKFDYSIQHTNSLNFAHQASACYRIEKTRSVSELKAVNNIQ